MFMFGFKVSKNSNCCDGFKFVGTITSYATKSKSFIIISSIFVSFFLFTSPDTKFLEFLYFCEYFVLKTSSLIINSPLNASGSDVFSFVGNFKNCIR